MSATPHRDRNGPGGSGPAAGDGPAVSIVVPCYNEREFIAGCLDSILETRYPLELLEVLVVDGMSDDGTRDILRRYAAEHRCIRALDNPKRITPAALNLGVAHARGNIIMRMDVHASFTPSYIPLLVRWSEESGADNVGGVAVTRPASGSAVGRAIAAGLSHPFGVGNSYFRIGVDQPRWVDTVPFGCYRRDVFDRNGLFDEELVRNQDDEFNARLIANGGRILLVPDVQFEYYPRDSLRKVWRMYFQYGYFKPLAIRKLGRVPTLRQLVPALFVLALACGALLAPWWAVARWAFLFLVAAYSAGVLAVSGVQASRRRDPGLLWLGVVFPILHTAYGLGFLRGGLDLLFRGKRPSTSTVPASR